jgi:apolipoprotein N-acyltransferase
VSRAGWLPLVIALGTGVALTFAFAPFDVWPLAIVCPAILMWLWQGASTRQSIWLGGSFGVGCFAAGTWWLYISVHLEADAPVWLAVLIVLAVVLLMASYYALLGFLVARLLPTTGAWRWLIGMPTLWLLMEWLRGWLFTGFPWLSLGYALTDTALSPLAPIVGSYGLSIVALLGSGALLALMFGSKASRTVALALLIVPWLAGTLLRSTQWTTSVGEPISVAIVQGAIPQNIKWQLANRKPTRDSYQQLNQQALGARLIVWPEAAVTDLANQIPEYLAAIRAAARAGNSDVVMGVLRANEKTGDIYNSILALTDAPAFYDKRHLVPYSEYFPVPDWVRRWLQRLNLPYNDISKGSEQQPLIHAAGLNIAATICYEDAFGHVQRHLLRESALLVNVTNDAWFGRSPARYQHLQISRMRAIEAQRFLVRAANDGVSAIVGPDGAVVQRSSEFRTAVLRGTVSPRRGLTPYIRMGDWPALTLAVLGVLLAALKGRFSGKIKRLSA